MKIQETGIDPSLQTVLGEMETRPLRGGFKVLDNTTAKQQTERALIKAEKTADIFWGIRRNLDGDIIPQTMLAKIGIIQDAVRVIPDRDGLSPQTSAFITEDIDLGVISKFEDRKVGVELPANLAALFRKSPQTALEAYRTPSVRELAHAALIEIGDPVTQIIDVYEQYQDRTPVIEAHALTLGSRALEHAAFAAGGQALVGLLGSSNRVFHESEVERRKLNR